jgi:hypothetical protein
MKKLGSAFWAMMLNKFSTGTKIDLESANKLK